MGLRKKIAMIMNELYAEKLPGDIVTKEKLILLIQDLFDVTGSTAKKYIKDIQRRELLERRTNITWEVKPKDEIDNKWLELSEED